jgi:hypothetical protein
MWHCNGYNHQPVTTSRLDQPDEQEEAWERADDIVLASRAGLGAWG